MHLPSFLAAVRSELSPHLETLRQIEQGAVTDGNAAERDLAALIASLMRDAAHGGHASQLAEIRAALDRIEQAQEKIAMSQSDIDAATGALTSAASTISGVAADLETAEANIQAEITALQNANPGLDTTALDAAVAGLSAPLSALQSADTSVDSLETPAAPAPAEPSAS